MDVAVHSGTGAVVIRPGVRYIEDGKLTKRFRALADSVLARYDKAIEELAK